MAVLWWEMAQDVHLSLLPASTSLMFAAQAHLSLSGDHLVYFMPSACISAQQCTGSPENVTEGLGDNQKGPERV